MSDPTGSQLGQYQLTQLIHRGAMSAIYRAYQPSLDRFVAIKVLFSEGDPQFAMRFKRSARMSAALQHPNILPTYDYGEQDNLLFLVLQYVEGGVTLDSMLGAPIDLSTAAEVMARLLGALDYAHKRGIIHRDVKPANIMMSAPNWPLLGDFGIAKIRSDNQRVTSSGLTIGTPAYMAPEQATGRSVDIRTDLYAAGIVFYYMLTGRVPFDAETPMDMLAKHVYEQPPSPRTLNPDIPIAVEQVMLRALEKSPAARYQSAAAMADAIGELAPEPTPIPPQSHLSSLYHNGAQAFASERWEAAIDLLSQLVALDPAHADAADMLAAAREMQRRAGGATGRLAESAGQHAGALMRQAGDLPSARADQRAPQAGAAPSQIQQPPTATASATAGPTREQPIASAPALQCPHCGHAISSDWSACPYCRKTLSIVGAVQPHHELPAPSSGKAPAAAEQAELRTAHARDRLGRAGLVGLLVLLAAAGTAGLVLARRAPTPASPTAAPQAAAVQTASAPTVAAPTSTAPPAATAAPAPTTPPVPTSPPAPPSPPAATAAPPEPTSPPPDAIVNLALLRLRAGPSTNYAFQHTYAQGTPLEVLGKEPTGTWLNVRAPDGQTGWMRASDLQVNTVLAALPIVEAPPSPTPAPTRRPTATPRPTAPPAVPAAPEPSTAAPNEPLPAPIAPPTELPTAAPNELPTPTEQKEDKPRPTRKPAEPTPPKKPSQPTPPPK